MSRRVRPHFNVINVLPVQNSKIVLILQLLAESEMNKKMQTFMKTHNVLPFLEEVVIFKAAKKAEDFKQTSVNDKHFLRLFNYEHHL